MIDEIAIRLGSLMQEAALCPAKWEPALNAVNDFVGSTGVALLSVNARSKFTPSSTNMAEMIEDYFGRGWYLKDRREACLPLLLANGVVFDHQAMSIEDIQDGDYYHDFLKRHGCKWFAGVGVEVDDDYWCLCFQRSPQAGAFGARDLERLQMVRGVLGNTALLSERIGRSWIAGLQSALETMGQAAILFDRQARVVDLNDMAGAIVKPFIGKDRHIQFDYAQATASLHELLGNASRLLEPRARREVARNIYVGGSAYRCRAISLLHHEELLATNAATLLLMEPIAESPARIMRDRYGLTRTEVKVSMALADGKSLKEIALEGQISTHTVRTHLKAIYNKTEVGRQAQLVAFVRNLADPKD